MGYEWGYFNQIWMEYYCLDKNHTSRTLSSRFIGCQNPYKLQNLKVLAAFQRHRNWHGQNFWKLFFLFEKTRLCRYYKNKNQLVVTSSSYISLMMKLLVASYLIAQRQSKSEILLFWGKQYLTFASDNSSSFQAS